MALTSAEDALLATIMGGQRGDSATRQALMNLIADKFGFSRSGDNLTGRLTIPGLASATGIGTPGNDSTIAVVETYNGIDHLTKLTLTAFAVGTGGDNEDLAIGALVYTFPAGTIAVLEASIVGTFDQASHGTITDGECGLGTTVGSTAVDTLGEVASTAENILEGDVGVLSTYVLGTGVVQASDRAGLTAQILTILSAGVHTAYLNLAATWPNIAAAEAVTFTGVITLRWRKVS